MTLFLERCEHYHELCIAEQHFFCFLTHHSFPLPSKDPFLFVDPYNKSILHGLSHAGGWDPRGGHVWSTDNGVTWKRHDDAPAAYGSRMEFLDGTSISRSRRERPHLVFDDNGVPLALTNGVTEAWPCNHPENCPADYCFTGLQNLNQD